MTAPKAPVTPMENIRELQSLKDSIIFLYDTDVHQLASFIRSGPPLGRTKLMLALGLSFQAPGTRISGPAASGQSIPPKQAEKVEKKVVEEDPPSSSKDDSKSIPSSEGPQDAGPPDGGPSIQEATEPSAPADPSTSPPPASTLPPVRKPNIQPVADPAFMDQKQEGTACKVSKGR